MQTQQFHVIPNTLFPCLPTPSPTSRPLHHQPSASRHPIIHTLHGNTWKRMLPLVMWLVLYFSSHLKVIPWSLNEAYLFFVVHSRRTKLFKIVPRFYTSGDDPFLLSDWLGKQLFQYNVTPSFLRNSFSKIRICIRYWSNARASKQKHYQLFCYIQ